jgi:arginine deiminase
MPDPTTDRASSTYGVHSEVGRLRKVLVCAPGLAHRRLIPTNADDLLFDGEMWVENAQRDHADFVNKLESRGVEVVELHELLAQTMAIPEAKEWLLDRRIIPNIVGLGLVDSTRARSSSRCSRSRSRSTSSAGSPWPTSPRTSAVSTSPWRRARSGFGST